MISLNNVELTLRAMSLVTPAIRTHALLVQLRCKKHANIWACATSAAYEQVTAIDDWMDSAANTLKLSINHPLTTIFNHQ